MSATLMLIFELIGTVAFAASGALTGLSKRMDIFGVVTLGIVTAVGGGVIRDIILGITPPATFSNPIYALVSTAVSIVIFIPAVRRLLFKRPRIYDGIMLVMDSLGLGIFTTTGIQTAYSADGNSNLFLLMFVGVVTGIGGGVLRDILAGNTPYIFIKHFYASASLLGSVVCILLWPFTDSVAAMLGGAATVIVLRLLAAKFRWSLPKAQP